MTFDLDRELKSALIVVRVRFDVVIGILLHINWLFYKMHGVLKIASRSRAGQRVVQAVNVADVGLVIVVSVRVVP